MPRFNANKHSQLSHKVNNTSAHWPVNASIGPITSSLRIHERKMNHKHWTVSQWWLWWDFGVSDAGWQRIKKLRSIDVRLKTNHNKLWSAIPLWLLPGKIKKVEFDFVRRRYTFKVPKMMKIMVNYVAMINSLHLCGETFSNSSYC